MFALLITKLRTGWREFVFELTDPYRPELHYMQGPGPKYQAKYGIKARLAYLAHSAEP